MIFVGVEGFGEMKNLLGFARGFTASLMYIALSGLCDRNYL